VARYTPLAAKNAIPRQDLETAVSLERAATAGVDAARAAAKRAEIDLGYTRVVAPVGGLVGKAEVKTGNLVGRGESTLLTTISDIDPIHVRVSFAERDYLTLVRKRLKEVKEHRGENQGSERVPSPPQNPDIEMVLADGSVHQQRGKVFFVDRAVDATTGTLLVEMEFPNPEDIVRPGQFAKVRAPIDFRKGAILVPQRAVQEIQATYNVAVVSAGDTIQMRPVKTGARLGSLWVIEDGLQPGERVVVEGLQKVQRGMKVQPTMVEIRDPNLVTAAPQQAVAATPR
jgi:membrane fusion protein (multidrug efflux system)